MDVGMTWCCMRCYGTMQNCLSEWQRRQAAHIGLWNSLLATISLAYIQQYQQPNPFSFQFEKNIFFQVDLAATHFIFQQAAISLLWSTDRKLASNYLKLSLTQTVTANAKFSCHRPISINLSLIIRRAQMIQQCKIF